MNQLLKILNCFSFHCRVNWMMTPRNSKISMTMKRLNPIVNKQLLKKDCYGSKGTNCFPNGKKDILSSLLITSNALKRDLLEWQKWENSFLRYVINNPNYDKIVVYIHYCTSPNIQVPIGNYSPCIPILNLTFESALPTKSSNL